ncbi:MAG: helix-turn-helix domain-containing protein [Gammaproteobacteria bacterium]
MVWRLLARHGWRKVAPDMRHPKSDPAAQEAWKKTPRTLAATLNQVDLRSRSVRLIFQDEARWRLPGAVGRRCPGDRLYSMAMNGNSYNQQFKTYR